MKRKLALIPIIFLLAGCSSYVRGEDVSNDFQGERDCYKLFKHNAGDDSTSDKALGYYCRVSISPQDVEPQVPTATITPGE